MVLEKQKQLVLREANGCGQPLASSNCIPHDLNSWYAVTTCVITTADVTFRTAKSYDDHCHGKHFINSPKPWTQSSNLALNGENSSYKQWITLPTKFKEILLYPLTICSSKQTSWRSAIFFASDWYSDASLAISGSASLTWSSRAVLYSWPWPQSNNPWT